MDYSIRRFEESDIAAVLEAWNRNLPRDRLSSELFLEKMFGDADYDPGKNLVARVDNQLAGFMSALIRDVPEGERVGWLKLFFTETRYRRQGIASSLLSRIESDMSSAGVSCLQVMDSIPNYLFPGVDPFYTETIAFLERRGFTKFDDTANLIADLDQDLDTTELEKESAQKGFVIRRGNLADLSSILSDVTREWPLWREEVEQAFKNDPISIHLAFYRSSFCAFSAYDVNNFNTGWFGPMGTLPPSRGQGIGGILLKRCLLDLKHQGHSQTIIPWVGPIPFYAREVNARVHRIFWRYKKDLGR